MVIVNDYICTELVWYQMCSREDHQNYPELEFLSYSPCGVPFYKTNKSQTFRQLNKNPCFLFFLITKKPHEFQIKVNHGRNRSSFPITTSVNDFCSAFVIGPIFPVPIFTLSICVTDFTSAAVPVMKISSAE